MLRKSGVATKAKAKKTGDFLPLPTPLEVRERVMKKAYP